jgi:hypothetical protein
MLPLIFVARFNKPKAVFLYMLQLKPSDLPPQKWTQNHETQQFPLKK